MELVLLARLQLVLQASRRIKRIAIVAGLAAHLLGYLIARRHHESLARHIAR